LLLIRDQRFIGILGRDMSLPAPVAMDQVTEIPVLHCLEQHAPACVRELAMLKPLDTRLEAPVCDFDRCGHVILDSPTPTDLQGLIAAVDNNVRLQTSDS
jgi:hypothetical protein